MLITSQCIAIMTPEKLLANSEKLPPIPPSLHYLVRGTLMLKCICHPTQGLLVRSSQVSHCGDIPFTGPFGGVFLQVIGVAAMKQSFLLDSKVILKWRRRTSRTWPTFAIQKVLTNNATPLASCCPSL